MFFCIPSPSFVTVQLKPTIMRKHVQWAALCSQDPTCIEVGTYRAKNKPMRESWQLEDMSAVITGGHVEHVKYPLLL